MKWIKRWSVFYLLVPHRYLDTGRDWSDFNLEEWTDNTYTYKKDEWGQKKDYVQYMDHMLVEGTGDCEDYSFVCASYLLSETDHELTLVSCYSLPDFIGHVLLYDSTDEVIYSSGSITNETLDEYKERTIYDVFFTRSL